MDYINNLFIIKKILVRRIFVRRADFCSQIGGKLSIIRGRLFFKGIAKELSYKMIRDFDNEKMYFEDKICSLVKKGSYF